MNLKLYFEIMKPAPDHDKLKRWMRTYVRVVAVQGTMQVADHRGDGPLRHRVLRHMIP